MLKEINLTKLIEHYYSVTKDSEPRVYGSFQATKTMLFEFGQQLLELAAENANLLIRKENMYNSSDNEILFDNEYSDGEYDSNGPDYHIDVMINKGSILDVINQVKLNSNERD